MAQNTSSEDEFSGFAPEEIPSDWIDKRNGRIYTTKEDSLGEIITITFFLQHMFELAKDFLRTVHSFSPNNAKTGLVSQTTIDGRKLV